MDDLQTLAAVLTPPEPSAGMIDRGRRRLAGAIADPGRAQFSAPARQGHRRRGWAAGGAGLAAAATAAAVLVSGVLAPTTPRGHHGARTRPRAAGGPPAAAQLPPARLAGQRILLAAATVAAAQHPGRYWHFKVKINMKSKVPPPPGVTVIDTYEDWVGLGSDYWSAQPACAAPAGTAVFDGPGWVPWYALGDTVLNYRVTRQLPTSPAALAAWLARREARGPAGSHADTDIANALIALLWQVPAPPPVRAAAYRALAAFPGVRSLGPVKGGQGLLISFPREPGAAEVTLVVDPATSLVRSESNFKSAIIIKAANWTNRLPRVIPLPPKNACGS